MRVGFDASISTLKVIQFVQDRRLDSGLGSAQRGKRAVQRVHGRECRR